MGGYCGIMPIYKTNKKKDGLQQYRVRVVCTDALGNTKQIERTAYGKQAAQDMEARLLMERDAQTPRITVSELVEEYLEAKRVDVRATTLDKSRRILQNAVCPLLGPVRLHRLTVQALQKWKADLSEKDLSDTTRKNYYKELNALLRYAVRCGKLDSNPLERVGNFKDRDFEKPKDKLRYYTKEQYLLYAAQARKNAQEGGKDDGWGIYTFFSVAFYTGARKGEINALRWSDVDGDALHIRRSVSQKLKGGDVFTPPKNKSSFRDVLIPAPLMQILKEQRERARASKGFSEDDLICGGKRPLRDTVIENANKAFAEAAGLPHIRIHDFRHTHATLLINHGINVQEIARRLGHSDVKMTWNTYAHLYPQEEQRALEILNKIE